MRISLKLLATSLLFLGVYQAEGQVAPTADNLKINEIMVSNIDQFISPTVNFDGWIELYNPTSDDVNLSGIYVSDEIGYLMQWKAPANLGVLPAGGYSTIWFDNNELKNTNVNFKLDKDGGSLYISDPMGNLIAEVTYPASKDRISYARTTDGGDTWSFTGEPTLGSSNNESSFASEMLPAPVISHDDQLFSQAFSASVEIPEGYTLHYTYDGTLPTETNGGISTTGFFYIYNTTCIRLRYFKEGFLPSAVTTRSYIKRDKNYTGPILSVVSDPKFLYDNKIGVMVRGTGGKPGHGQDTPCNWNMDWERPVNFSYIPQDGKPVVNRNVDLEMCGGWSRAWEPHSFKLKGSKEYDGKNLNYQFFSKKPYIRNRTLQIRNGGNDNYYRFKDAALETVIMLSGIDIDNQCYVPVHEFINGKYIGVLNMREPNNKHYVYANYGWDDDEIDQFEMDPDSAYVQKCGDSQSWDHLYELCKTASQSATYEEIRQCLDIDEFINYMAMQLYLGGNDWPQNNVKAFTKRPDGRFRFVSFDLDFAFNESNPFTTFANKQTYTFNYLYDQHKSIRAEIKMVTIFLNLLKNDDFRKQFIDTFCIMGGSVFESSHYTPIIDSLAARAEEMMALEDIHPMNSASEIKTNLAGRNNTMINAMRNYSPMKLTSKTAQTVKLNSDVDGATIYINDLKIPTGRFNGKLFAPVTLRAEAPAGYTFNGWLDEGGNSEAILSYGSTWSYYDQGSLDGINWKSENYDVSSWKQGQAPLGYGKTGINTTLSYGNNSDNKRPTYYFRRNLNLTEDPKAKTDFTLNFTVDDGFIIYVNGTEAGRYNMPSGNVSYSTYATTYAPGNPDTGSMTLPASLFNKGNNVIAVEVHNNSGTSTDIYWDTNLESNIYQECAVYYSTEPEINLPEGAVSLTACFEPMSPEELNRQGINPVRINEISADNSVFVNEYWKKNDWVELYNTTDHEIDIEGMYLTDNPSKPHKWQISKGESMASTIIPAHGYLLIWCDKLDNDLALHASFKIDNEGGTMVLTAADDSWSDEMPYPEHDGNTSVGRYPDGGGNIYVMNNPTIEKTNMLSSYSTLFKSSSDGIGTMLMRSSSKITMRYVGDELILRGCEGRKATVTIYTLSGQQAGIYTPSLNGGEGTCHPSNLSKGCYMARVIDSEGNSSSCKFIIN